MERLEVVELFAHADKLNRLAGNGLNTQGGTTTGVTVKLGQDHPVQFQPLVEFLRRVDRVLTGHRIADQINLVRVDGFRDHGDLVHHLFVNMQTTSGIKNHDIEAVFSGVFKTVLGNLNRVLNTVFPIDLHAQLLAERTQLLDRGGALQVIGHHQRFLAVFFDDQLGQFGRSGRFTGTLEPCHHYDGRSRRDIINLRIHRPHQFGQFIANDFDQDLPGMQALDDLSTKGRFFDILAELLGHLVVNIRFQQGLAHLTHRVSNIGLGNAAATR